MAKRIGILTAGGDAPGLNAAIRGLGKAATGRFGMEVIGFRGGIRGLAEDHWDLLNKSDLSGILTLGGTILGTSRDKPHRMVIDGEPRDMIPTIAEVVERNNLDCVAMLGGGGTAKNALRLHQAGIPVVHLPKTIDRDIARTDNTFGFATALEIATEAIDRLHSTAHSHHRVILAEIMGHKAGWLALGAGIAGGADVILLPEIPYHIDSIVETIEQRKQHGTNFSVIAVAEGARDKASWAELEAALALKKAAPSPEAKAIAAEHLRQVQYAHRESTFRLARQIEERTGLESRVTILGYVQRGGIPVGADRLLGSKIGTAAAQLIEAGHYGVMVASQGDDAGPVPLEEVAGKDALVPLDHPWIQVARDVGTGMGD